MGSFIFTFVYQFLCVMMEKTNESYALVTASRKLMMYYLTISLRNAVLYVQCAQILYA